MSEHDDYDLEQLAEQLHLSPAQVLRLAERGQIPGRRTQGAWRFHRAEIAQWWEQRIAAADGGQLADWEQVLSAPRGRRDGEDFRLTDFLPLEAIELNLQARTASAVLPALVQVGSRTGLIWDPERLITALRAREELHSTALENGVALVHPRRPQAGILGDALIAFARTPSGIPFGNSRGQLTDLFFMLCMLDDRMHLRLLARLSRLLIEPGLLTELRTAQHPRDVLRLLSEYEERILTASAGGSPS